MTPLERRAVSALASIYGLRMLGLFLILPVFAIYAQKLDGVTPLMIGLALGAYGLTQAMFQIPYGIWSDRWARKPVITIGLLVFALGSLVAALSTSIEGVIAGRALQGAGAIGAAVLALTADLTRDEQRTKAMAAIGITIGAMFTLSLMMAPVLDNWLAVPGIFWLTAVLTIVAIAVLWWVVPAAPEHQAQLETSETPQTESIRRQITTVLGDSQLLKLDIGICLLHWVLTSLFVVVPGLILDLAGWPVAEHWKIYVPVLLLSVAGMAPLIRRHSGENDNQRSFSIAITLLAVSQFVLALGHSAIALMIVGLLVFFIGFNALEAMLPSEISRQAPAANKGAALGVYNTFEYGGIFIGGLVGGWLAGSVGAWAVFGLNGILIVIWLFLWTQSAAVKTIIAKGTLE